MKSEVIKWWPYKVYLLFLFAYCSCLQTFATTAFQAPSHLDSLLLEAIEASKDQEFDVVLAKFRAVISEAESINDHRNEILGTINLGLLYLSYNADEDALNYLLLSLDLTKKHDLKALLNTIYNNIGVVYSRNEEFGQAEGYFNKALKISQQRKEQRRIAINLINLGELKSKQKEINQANDYYQQALDIFQELGDTNNIAMVLNNIGSIYYQEENYTEAKSHFQGAFDLTKNDLDRFSRPLFQLNYGKTIYQFQAYDSAVVYLKTALDSFLLVKNTEKIIESNYWLAKTYEQKGKYEMAKFYYEECLNWKDILLKEKNQLWVSEIQMKYEFGKKEKEIEFLQEKAKQEKLIWGGVIFAVFIFSALLFYSLRTKNTNLKQKNIILKKEQQVANLEIAQNQLLQEQLKQKLEAKNRELASKALHLVNKNEILTSVTSLLDQLTTQNEPSNANLVRNAKKTIAQNINLDEQWKDFKIHFEKVHAGFFRHLLEEHPTLSQTDLRLCAYLLINLDSKEIAQISNISPDSVRKRKQRLREKLNLSKDQDIRLLLNKFELV